MAPTLSFFVHLSLLFGAVGSYENHKESSYVSLGEATSLPSLGVSALKATSRSECLYQGYQNYQAFGFEKTLAYFKPNGTLSNCLDACDADSNCAGVSYIPAYCFLNRQRDLTILRNEQPYRLYVKTNGTCTSPSETLKQCPFYRQEHFALAGSFLASHRLLFFECTNRCQAMKACVGFNYRWNHCSLFTNPVTVELLPPKLSTSLHSCREIYGVADLWRNEIESSSNCLYRIDDHAQYTGKIIGYLNPNNSLSICLSACDTHKKCTSVSYIPNYCYLHSNSATRIQLPAQIYQRYKRQDIACSNNHAEDESVCIFLQQNVTVDGTPLEKASVYMFECEQRCRELEKCIGFEYAAHKRCLLFGNPISPQVLPPYYRSYLYSCREAVTPEVTSSGPQNVKSEPIQCIQPAKFETVFSEHGGVLFRGVHGIAQNTDWAGFPCMQNYGVPNCAWQKGRQQYTCGDMPCFLTLLGLSVVSEMRRQKPTEPFIGLRAVLWSDVWAAAVSSLYLAKHVFCQNGRNTDADKYYPGRALGWCRVESALGAAFASLLPQSHAIQCLVALDRILKLHPRTAVKVKSSRYKFALKASFAIVVPITNALVAFGHNFNWETWDFLYRIIDVYYIGGYPYSAKSVATGVYLEVYPGTPKVQLSFGSICLGINTCDGDCELAVISDGFLVVAVCVLSLGLIYTFVAARRRAAAVGNSWVNVTSNQTLALVSLYDSLLSIIGLLSVFAYVGLRLGNEDFWKVSGSLRTTLS